MRTLNVTVYGGGTTDPPAGLNSYTVNTYLTLTATPNAGSSFDHWQLYNTQGVNYGPSTSNPEYLVMDQNFILQAYFTADPTPTPSPTASPTPTGSPTPTATPIPTPTPFPTPTPTGTPTYKEASVTKPIGASWIAQDGTLYAGVNSTLYKSQDQGVTWQSLITFSGANAGINYVYVNKLNNIFVAPDTNAATSSLGIWRSTDGGQTWAKVLPLPLSQTTMAMAEDSNGNLFAGIYTTGSYTANATICKSTDGGASWSIVYYDSTARHIHCVAVDLANNYVYASVGDVRVWNGLTGKNWDIDYVIQSTADGNSNTWTKILQGTSTSGDSQMLAISIVDTVGANGQLIPAVRLFGTDYDNGQIYRTTDDVHFSRVLDTGAQSYCFWIRRNDLNGYIYASFVGGDNPSQWVAGIWVSTNNGLSWSVYKTFPIHHAYYGSTAASNFVGGTMYYCLQLETGWQNGIKIYPDYSGSSIQIQDLWAFALGISQFSFSMFRGVLVSPSSISVFTGIALAAFMLSKSKSKMSVLNKKGLRRAKIPS
jgi:hypothetical protein